LRNTILELLRNNQGHFVSGEDMSRGQDVSRTAVWKHIQTLRSDGYIIESHPRQGYCLVSVPDVLLPGEIQNGLRTTHFGRKIYHFPTIGSTNQEAKRLAVEGAPHGTIVVAETQTSGKGRLARHWFSPAEGGIWFSVILRPGSPPTEAAKFTFLGAVAVAKAIRELTGLAVEIKWPNDIHYEGRKLVGILTELNAEMDAINYIVMGIGINVNVKLEEYPEELRKIVSSIQRELGQAVSRQKLLCMILEQMEYLYARALGEGFQSVFSAWRAMNCTLGYEVNVVSVNQEFTGTAVDIDEEGALLIKKTNGTLERVIAGDVSVRRRI
jgi:BirA family transcriptional regulator, biotin operon repressor / biotin---[acetyl-CoA-carboxylase] ligase